MAKLTQDKLWKGIIEDLFEDLMYYFYPKFSTEQIDWQKGYEFLDKELNQIYPVTASKNRFADRLVKIYLLDGSSRWILVHIEVQGYSDDEFAERMFVYYYRCFDKYKKPIMALAIYTDDNPLFCPTFYEQHLEQTKLRYEFDTFKLLENTSTSLHIAGNPFSIVMQTAKAFISKHAKIDEQQKEIKLKLIRDLYEAGYKRDKIEKILNFIRHYVSFKDNDMLSSFETILYNNKDLPMGINEYIKQAFVEEGMEKGMEKGLEKGMEKGLEKGLEKGMEKGVERGLAKGKEQERKKAETEKNAIILALIKDGAYSMQQIASITNVALSRVKQVKKTAF